MTNQAQTTVAPNAEAPKAEAPKVTFVPAPVSAEAGAKAVKAIVAAALGNVKAHDRAQAAFDKATAKAETDLLANMVDAAKLIGVPLTEAQWSRQFAKAVEKGLKLKLAAASVPGALSRAKVVTLAYLAGDAADASHFGKPLMGEKAKAYLERVRPLMGEAKTPAGDWVLTRNPDGTPKAKAGAKQGPKVTPTGQTTAATAQDAEGGLNVAPAKANAEARENAASVLMGNAKDAATLLAFLARKDGAKALLALLAKADAAEAPKAEAPAPTKGRGFVKLADVKAA